MDINVNSMLTVVINTATGKIECGCCYHEEMGIPCVHAIAVIRAIGRNPVDPIWFDSGLTVDSYISEYAAIPVSIGCIKLRESTIVKMQPDHHIVRAGRPRKKKRISRPTKRYCCGCGENGHFLSPCTKVKIGSLCQTLKDKVNHAAKLKFAEWDGEMNPLRFTMGPMDDFTVEVTDVEQLPNGLDDKQSDDHDDSDNDSDSGDI